VRQALRETLPTIMTITDLLNSPWAIAPERLLELQAIYATHLRGDKIDIEAIEARLGRPLANEQKAYSIIEGTSVAVLEIAGVIAPKANMFTRISGGAAASLLQQQMQSMAADPRVTAVVIDADSPGGNVLGIPALADALAALAQAKPTVTVCTGTMCSAMYWVGAAANSVYLSGATDFVGSIGVVATHTYDPRGSALQKTEITAGQYKRIASDTAPLSAEGRAYMQAQVDQLYSVFVDAVARFRGVSTDAVLTHMADGRVFIGQQAIDAGLADGFATVDQMVERLAAEPGAYAQRKPARIAATSGSRPGKPKAAAAAPVPAPAARTSQGTSTMPTPQEVAAAFKAENPEAAALLVAEGHTAGAAAELSRIQAVRGQSMPGHEALIDKLAFDGKTTGPEAAMAVIAAERAAAAAQASARSNEAPKPVAAAPAPADAPAALGKGGRLDHTVDAAALDAAAKAYMAANPGTSYVAAVKAVQQGA
jgi:signal peptide peptidase SppA